MNISVKEFQENLKKIIFKKWDEEHFGTSTNKALYKKQLNNLFLLDSLNKLRYKNHEKVFSIDEIAYETESDRTIFKIVCGVPKISKSSETGQEYLNFTYKSNLSAFAKLVVDYLLGRFAYYNERLYDINGKQMIEMTESEVNKRYNTKNETQFILEILKGIHNTLNIEPKRKIEPFKISGNDFVIDFENHTTTRASTNNACYFKYFDANYNDVVSKKDLLTKFLSGAIADEKSLNNALLQTYYIIMTLMHLEPREKFFISKSQGGTGKGLRHEILKTIFKNKEIRFENFYAKGYESSNSWAMLEGIELALAVESGAIVGEQVENFLKRIGTESQAEGRQAQGNYKTIVLKAVLSVDTNEVVALSDTPEIERRKVLIQYQDRPDGETEEERRAYFKPFWQELPNICGGLCMLVLGQDRYKQNGNKFAWGNVELDNSLVDLDSFQLLVIEELEKSNNDYVVRTDEMNQAIKQEYRSNNALNNALKTLGLELSRKRNGKTRLNTIVIKNKERYNKILSSFKEIGDNSSIFTNWSFSD